MEDISLHLLDIAENALRADAKRIEIVVTKDSKRDRLQVDVIDNGGGMDTETLARVRDPFFTTKQKKTGLGIPLLAHAAEQAGGKLTVDSAPGRGTRVTAVFQWSHIDRPAIGDLTETLMVLIAGHPDIEIVYEEREGARLFRVDTAEIKADLDGVPINSPPALEAVKRMLQDGIQLKQ